MRQRGRRIRPVVGLLAVVALVLSACGSGTTSKESSGFDVATVAQTTVDAGSARVAETSMFTAENGKKSFDTTVGELDFERMRSSFETTGEAEGKSFVLHSRYIDGFVYLSPPDATSFSPDFGSRPVADTTGKEWVRQPHPLDSEFELLRMVDAAGFIGVLERAGGQAELIGSEEIRGVSAEHYRVSFEARAVPKQLEAMSLMGPASKSFDVWADAEHRLRRLEGRFESSFGSWEWDIEVFDFGVPVTIEVPPSGTVAIDDSSALSGDWKMVQSGTAGTDQWRLYRAPTTEGVCFSPETDPRSPRVGGPTQSGRSVALCSYEVLNGPDDVLAVPANELTAGVFALPNGMAVLYGHVTPDAKTLTLHFSDDRVEKLTPTDETFAIAVAADKLVQTIVLEGADAKVSCDLDEHKSYTCDGTLAPSPWSDPPVFPEFPPTGLSATPPAPAP